MHRGTLSQTTWLLTWLTWIVLFSQQAADAWVHGMPAIIWFGKLFPLLLFLPGMLRDRLRSFIWLCFVSLMYFIALVERAFAQPGALMPIIGLSAVVILFCSAMMYVRWRARELRPAEPVNVDGEPADE
ncbi:MAG: DUF2069 domain-containing protein [Halieaceae bacterium]